MTVALLGVENPFLASFDPPFSAERPATGSDLLKEGLDNFAQAERRVQSLLRVQDFNAGRHCLSANYLIYGFIYLSSRYLLSCLQICLTILICFLHVYMHADMGKDIMCQCQCQCLSVCPSVCLSVCTYACTCVCAHVCIHLCLRCMQCTQCTHLCTICSSRCTRLQNEYKTSQQETPYAFMHALAYMYSTVYVYIYIYMYYTHVDSYTHTHIKVLFLNLHRIALSITRVHLECYTCIRISRCAHS